MPGHLPWLNTGLSPCKSEGFSLLRVKDTIDPTHFNPTLPALDKTIVKNKLDKESHDNYINQKLWIVQNILIIPIRRKINGQNQTNPNRLFLERVGVLLQGGIADHRG
jgi:hypothetical protein